MEATVEYHPAGVLNLTLIRYKNGNPNFKISNPKQFSKSKYINSKSFEFCIYKI